MAKKPKPNLGGRPRVLRNGKTYSFTLEVTDSAIVDKAARRLSRKLGHECHRSETMRAILRGELKL